MAYVPAERKTEGMVGGMSAAENLVLARTGQSGWFVNKRKQKKLAQEWFDGWAPGRTTRHCTSAGSPAATSRRSSWPSGCSRRPCNC